MKWFGDTWHAPVCDPEQHVETPVGTCIWCEEEIEDGDSGIIYMNGPVAHRECFIRQVVGGVNHQLGRCTCRGGREGPDPPNMTAREAARAAERFFLARPQG